MHAYRKCAIPKKWYIGNNVQVTAIQMTTSQKMVLNCRQRDCTCMHEKLFRELIKVADTGVERNVSIIPVCYIFRCGRGSCVRGQRRKHASKSCLQCLYRPPKEGKPDVEEVNGERSIPGTHFERLSREMGWGVQERASAETDKDSQRKRMDRPKQ